MASVKVAVSLPEAQFQAVEKVRKKLGRSRSSLIAEALGAWLEAQKKKEKIRRYIAGYKRHPETSKEIKEAASISEEALSKEEWDG
jgi:metal-responsive CopG/Arc/MetJ family transcriptional regulator